MLGRLLGLMLILTCGVHANAQQVLVSIHPMALMVKTAWPELEVDSLVAPNQSPHDFTLKPSDRRKIHKADAVIWLGEEFEPYLAKVLKKQTQVDLADIAEAEHHAPYGAHGHSDEAHDPHLWLNPKAIFPILDKIKKALKLDEPEIFKKRFQLWHLKAQRQLYFHSKAGFVSFHDAFHYWVEEFNLNQLDMVAINPEQPVGTKHITKIRELLASGNVQCMFLEPQFNAPIVNKLHKGLDIKVVNIDPMASMHQIESANFLEFYDELLEQFLYCFASN